MTPMTPMGYIHVTFEAWGSIFCLIAAASVYIGRRKENKTDRCMIALESTIALLLAMDAVAWAFRGYPGSLGAAMVRVSNFLVFFTSYVILAEYTTYQRLLIAEQTDFPVRAWSGAIYCISAFGMILVCISQFTDLFYYIDADNYYHRTDQYYISMVLALVGMFLSVYMVVCHRRCFSRETFISLLAYMVLPVIAAVIQIRLYGISLLNIAIAVSVMMLFFSWQKDRSQQSVQMTTRLLEQQQEISRQQVRLMVSQIRPHFLFNSLTAIAQMCEADPKTARNATISFAEFLRANMDSLTEPEPVPFAKELENIENYLVLEQIRFGDGLKIEYDIETEDFKLPPLTVQPLVENAIKHGIHQKGTVRVLTRKLADAYEVAVEDDGVGYDGSSIPDDGRSHIGIKNIRDRLSASLQATLSYQRLDEGGTAAIIRIPLQEEERGEV